MKTIEEYSAELLKYPTGNICDANNKKGNMDSEIKPLDPKMKLAGAAYTVECSPGDNLAIHCAIYEAPPGSVLVIDAKGFASGYFGEILATACIQKGIKGIVIDGGCRDSLELIRLDFPIFSKYINPGGTIKKEKGKVGVKISCGGVDVESGDFIVADADGIVVIKKNDVEEVLNKTKIISFREIEAINSIKEGKSTLEIFDLKKLL